MITHKHFIISTMDDNCGATCSSLLGEVSKIIPDASVLRRLLFAVSVLPNDTPDYWSIIAKFAVKKSSTHAVLLPEQARLTAENIVFLDKEVLSTDTELFRELAMMPFKSSEAVGVMLISKREFCVECGGRLLLRRDRPSRIVLYTDSYGTLPSYHYRKYCANNKKGCHIVQHYGFYTDGATEMTFDSDWEDLQYFVSTQETAFELKMLVKFDAELLVGQISYKQRAEIYNITHGYDYVKKTCKHCEDIESDDSSCGDTEDL